MIPRMILKQMIQVCREELQKAKDAIVAVYQIIREADERAFETLLIFLGIR